MFERFSRDARRAVTLAQDEATLMRHSYLGTEHLLLGIIQVPGAASRVLRDLGIRSPDVRSDLIAAVGLGSSETDADALRTIGINLDEVRRRVEEAFGPGALDQPPARKGWRRTHRCDSPFGGRRFTPRAKKVLELSLREAIRLGDDHIGTEHVLLGLVREGKGLAVQILSARGISADRIGTRLAAELGEGRSPGLSA
jgi:ATP-dependent Clp protease ATP-binding subunit ClpA